MAVAWTSQELDRCAELVRTGRTYKQIARTLNAEFHERRVLRTEKAVELKCRRSERQATTLRGAVR